MVDDRRHWGIDAAAAAAVNGLELLEVGDELVEVAQGLVHRRRQLVAVVRRDNNTSDD